MSSVSTSFRASPQSMHSFRCDGGKSAHDPLVPQIEKRRDLLKPWSGGATTRRERKHHDRLEVGETRSGLEVNVQAATKLARCIGHRMPLDEANVLRFPKEPIGVAS